jgi:exosome complex component RRP41|uniref:Exoribonuclease phosphorolytic domain-containing protein n=1 Tax=Phaeodactylum tricornutum TaxID=2850 RepID=A0A8J9SRK4_PHATR
MSSSIRRTDLLALSNLRNDGRKPHEIRRMRVQMSPLSVSTISGSALVEMGLTVVLATVRGPVDCLRRADENPDQAVLDVTVQSAPFSSSADRRVANPKTDRRLIEASHMLKRAMEAAILLHLYPKSRIELVVSVLADDGGRLCAAINAATLALMDAGIPMKDFVCACSAGLPGTSATPDSHALTLVDLNRQEESSTGGQAATHMPVALLPQRNTLVLAQCEARLPNLDTLERVLDAATEGCRAVFDILQAAVREHAATVLAARSGTTRIISAFD